MLYLIIIFGAFVSAGFIAPINFIVTGDISTFAGVITLEIFFFIPLFVLCLVRYLSPAYKAKQKQRKEENAKWQSISAEIARFRKMEEERKRPKIVSTTLLGRYTKHKKKKGSMLARGAIGGFLGGASGATLGMATAKNNNQKIYVFLVKYHDGHVEEKEAVVGTAEYEEYMKYLDKEN